MFESIKRVLELLAGVKVAVKLSDNFTRNFTSDAPFILNNTELVGQHKPVGRFAYNPKTGELVMGTMDDMHAVIIGNQSSSKFDDFVRGVWDGRQIMLRWYSTDPYATPDEIRSESFEAWSDTKEMLERNGMPPGTPVTIGVDTQTIQKELGRPYK